MAGTVWSDRLLKKQQAIDLHRAVLGHCHCDLCGVAEGTEYHEIVSRWRTMASEAAREASFEPPICALVCHACHMTVAPTIEGRKRLWAFNVALYGRESVEAALTAIPEQFWVRIGYT